MLTYGFYNSDKGDRKYNARKISALFDGLIHDGVFASIGTAMIVEPISDNIVGIGAGRAWFNHTWTDNDSVFPIEFESPDPIFDRYDSIVLEVNELLEVRANSYKILKGAPSVTPAIPELVETVTVHQHRICNVYRRPGVTVISASDVTNLVGLADFPYVTGILDTVNVEQLMLQWDSQWQDWKQAKIDEHNLWEADFQDEAESIAESFQSASEATFLAWLNNLQIQLSGDVVANLQGQIDTANTNIFYRYYDLLERATVLTKDIRGDVVSIVETSSAMLATTTFVKTNGLISQINTVLVPTAGAFQYLRSINIVEDSVAKTTTMTETVTQSAK